MSNVQIESVRHPFDDPQVASMALNTLIRADAMGLLSRKITCLDNSAIRCLGAGLERAGICRRYLAELRGGTEWDAKRLSGVLEETQDALGESPVPATEWPVLQGVLGAEFLRHEEIFEAEDLFTIRRDLWAVEIGERPGARPELPPHTLVGGPSTWPDCQREAGRWRNQGEAGITAPSAALRPGATHGSRVEGGLRQGTPRDGQVFALFGPRPDLVGWVAAASGHPSENLLPRVRHYQARLGAMISRPPRSLPSRRRSTRAAGEVCCRGRCLREGKLAPAALKQALPVLVSG